MSIWVICCLIIFGFTPLVASQSLVFSIETTSANTVFFMPLCSPATTVSLRVFWGDGADTIHSSADTVMSSTSGISHTYSTAGNFTVTASPYLIGPHLTCFGWRLNDGWDGLPTVRLINVTSFGSLGITSLEQAFARCTTSFSVPANIPTTVIDLSGMFFSATNFNWNIASWDVSRVTTMHRMFYAASSFNQPIGSWNISSGPAITSMFYLASSFNQPLGSWDVRRVTSLEMTFRSAFSFNQPLASWDVSSVTSLWATFRSAGAFNQPIGSWNVSSVDSMYDLFYGASSFNSPIGSWNVGSVTNMNGMFFGATSFDQSIGSWNVGSVGNMISLFRGAASFNQPIGSWDVSSVTIMSNMFYGASSFNQTIASWDVRSVSLMDFMFFDATSFNSSISTWCVSQIPTRPMNFADQSQLLPTEEPRWGSCPSTTPVTAPPTPVAAPLLAPSTTMSPIVFDVPQTSQPTSGSAPSVTAPVAPPVTPSCFSPRPDGNNVTCIAGRWVLTAESSLFNQVVTVRPNITIAITGPVNNNNITIVFEVAEPRQFVGSISFSDCVDMKGSVRVKISQAVVVNGSTILLLSSSRPECFNPQITAEVEGPCGQVIKPVPVVEYSNGQAQLLLLFSVSDASQIRTEDCSLSLTPSGTSSLAPSVIAAIVVVVVIAGAVVSAAVGYFVRKRRFQQESAALHAKLVSQGARAK